MLKQLTGAALLASTAVLPASAQADNENNMSREEQTVLDVVTRMTEAFHDKNIKGVMASYENEASVVFEPGKPVTDPAVVREMFQGMFAVDPKFSYSGHQVFVKGDIAIHLAPWKMTGTAPDREKIGNQGLSVAVLRKQTDGRWLMVIDNPHGQILPQD